MRAVLAALDMAAESRGTAALDGRHDLQLVEAQVSGVGGAPGRTVAAEDIRQLDRWTRQGGKPRSGGRSDLSEQQVERAGDLADRLDGDTRVERRGVELLVAEQYLDDADVGLLLEQVRRETMP